uniref:Zinc finger PHD-type domain-containing protein n=1 Tax=Psilocybe cubensis TaxID=181762 RepID=A0A8H7XJQ8_PSICU
MANTESTIEVDADGYAKCPDCFDRIRCGPGGIKNLEARHRGTAKCRAKAAKLQKSGAKLKDGSISMFLKRTNPADKIRVPSQTIIPKKIGFIPESTPLLSTPLQKMPSELDLNLSQHTETLTVAVSNTVQRLPVTWYKSNLANKMQTLVNNLPAASQHSTSDLLEGFNRNPAEYDDLSISNEDLWEVVLNPLLKSLLGWGTSLDVAAVIEGQHDGLNGLAPFIEYFVVQRHVEESLLEGKFSHLIEGLNKQQLKLGPGYIIPGSKTSDLRLTSAACKGYILDLPNGRSPHSAYPFALHDILPLPWTYEVKNHRMIVRSLRCGTVEVPPHSACCSLCSDLSSNSMLLGIISRIQNGVDVNTPYAYHSMDTLRTVLARKDKQINFLKLQGVSQARAIVRKSKSLDERQRLIIAIASKQVGHVERLLEIGIRQKRSITYILQQYKLAAIGVYHPKSYSDMENMLGLLLMDLGGNRISGIVHRSLGLPGITTLRTKKMVPLLIPSASTPTITEITANITACFQGLSDVLADANVMHTTLAFDEIATEARIRWDEHTNNFLGVCREHGRRTALEFNSQDDVEELFHCLDKGEIHYAREATVGALGIMSPNNCIYAACPILISGDCKRETAEEHAEIIKTVINSVTSTRQQTKLRLVSIASDGETRRGSAFALLTFKHWLSLTSPIFPLLTNMTFMDLHVGDDDLTADKDWKHVFKRFRNLLLRPRGLLISGVRITPSIISTHLKMSGLSAVHVASLCNPNDEQDVKLAFDLLRAIWSLPTITEHQNPSIIEARASLVILGKLFYHIVFPYFCVDLTLSEQLEHISAAVHLALALYHESGTQFIPALLYTDLQIMAKNIFFCVAKAKVHLPHSQFYLVLLGTDRLEEIFGILRTMIGNDSNVDIWQLSSRLTGTTEVSNILAKYPHWDRAPRRLKMPALTRLSQELPDSSDHIKPASWKGNVSVANVTLLTSWKRGRFLLEAECPWIIEILARLECDSKYGMLSPHGKILVGSTLFEHEAHDDISQEIISLERPIVDSDISSTLTSQQANIEDQFLTPFFNESMPSESFIHYTSPDEENFTRTVLYNGDLIPKSRALSLHSKHRGQRSVASTDRLRRVQGAERFGKAINLSEAKCQYSDNAQDIVSILDPVVTLVKCEQHLFLCLGEVNSIKIHSESPVEAISMDDINESDSGKVSISMSILGLRRSTVGDDPTLKADWRTYRLLSERTIHTPAKMVLPINPTIHTSGIGQLYYLLEGSVLVALVSQLRSTIDSDKGVLKKLPQVSLGKEFPYYEESGKACFSASFGLKEALNCCPMCEPPFNFAGKGGPRILEHIGSHILHDPLINRDDEPCGLCLRPSPQCVFFLKKGTGGNIKINTQASLSCPNVIYYKYAVAEKSTSSSPCSNVPIYCPICPKTSPAVWRYNLKYHMIKTHPSASLARHSHLWDLSSFEKSQMKNIWINRLTTGQTRSGSSKAKKSALVISDAHTMSVELPQHSMLSDLDNVSESDSCSEESEIHDDNVLPTPQSEIQSIDNPIDTNISECTQVTNPADIQPNGNDDHVHQDTTLHSESLISQRPRRKRTYFDLNGLSVCVCGLSAHPATGELTAGLAKCKRVNCETVWYHISCLTPKVHAVSKTWACSSCLEGKRSRY